MTTTTRVEALEAAQVISLPSAGISPALITQISQPVSGIRFMLLDDWETGEPREGRLVLGLDRLVEVHDVVVAHHRYTNISDTEQEALVGNRLEVIDPGGSVHYTGAELADRFPVSLWEHTTEPVEIASEHRAL